ncbi:MAG: hypothetical protein HY899_09710 [Deltaproteobacteria bacterium]|nr:hypothetical protein [Deltaproteobacteria bacterium]
MQRNALFISGLVFFALTVSAHADPVFIKQFEQVYGSGAGENGYFVIETADHGFLAAGNGSSDGGTIFAVKTDSNGVVEWQQEYGDPSATLGSGGVVQTADGGFVLAGSTSPFPPPEPPAVGDQDGIMIKIDASGNEVWRTSFGGSSGDIIYALALADDGSLIGAGSTTSDIGPKDPASWGAYFVKLSGTGTLLSQVAYDHVGPTDTAEEAIHMDKTPDGDFIVTGMAYYEGWFLLKIDDNLGKLWASFYGDGNEDITSIASTPDGGFVAAGVRGDSDTGDALLVRLDPDPGNPAGPVVIRNGWPKTYVRNDHDSYDIFYYADATPDGGIIAAGFHFLLADPDDPFSEFSRFWVAKMDADGNIERESLYAESGAREVHVTSDGGYIVVGGSDQFPAGLGNGDLYLLRLHDGDPGFIAGGVYVDEDGTCSLSAGETGAAWHLVRLVDTTTDVAYLAMTSLDGSYAAAVPSGDYTATLAPGPLNLEADTCPVDGQSYAVSVTTGATESGNDFFAQCNCQVGQSLTGEAVEPAYDCGSAVSSSPCAGYQWQICYQVTNLCNPLHENPGGGGNFVKACVNLPADTTYAGPETITTNNCGGTGNWHLLPSTAVGQVCFELDSNNTFTSGCQADMCFPINIEPAYQGGTVTAQFMTNQCTGDVAIPPAPPLTYGSDCSCDPNAMHVTPQGCEPEGAITGQELTYRVDFQNLGAGNAHNVVVTDVLDVALDAATLRLVDASHTVTSLQLNDGGVLVVHFDQIELPAESLAIDPEDSKGHVTFAITPKEPYDDGVAVRNTASIVFDSNEPVITNTVLSTLYNGDPVPVVDFDVVLSGEFGLFTYTGGTTGADFAWDFGPDASPRASTEQDPTAVEFFTAGVHPVVLAATKAGCTARAVKPVDISCNFFWTTSPFRGAMGASRRRVGRVVKLKLRQLEYKSGPLGGEAELDTILEDDFARVPDGSCWPRLRVFTADGQQEVALTGADFVGTPANPDGCLRFRPNGALVAKIRLNPALFAPNTDYIAALQVYTCTVMPDNNGINTRP